MVDDAGHWVQQEKPDEVNAALISFLDKVDSSDRQSRSTSASFYAPFHPVGQNPTLALEYDLERVAELDRLGYDEAWFGEHHSGGYELIGSPEIFIAAAAERTKHIKLGTGVVSLPYHHPWLVADRMVQLDHMTRGRVHLRHRSRRAARPTPSSWASTRSTSAA